MDINHHIMGEEIYVGDLEKEISKVDGVLNLIDIRVLNPVGGEYSDTQIGQPMTPYDEENSSSESGQMVDLSVTDGVLYNEGDTMMEIKDVVHDIRVRLKER